MRQVKALPTHPRAAAGAELYLTKKGKLEVSQCQISRTQAGIGRSRQAA